MSLHLYLDSGQKRTKQTQYEMAVYIKIGLMLTIDGFLTRGILLCTKALKTRITKVWQQGSVADTVLGEGCVNFQGSLEKVPLQGTALLLSRPRGRKCIST